MKRLVEAGLSLKKARVRFGLAYSYLVQKAQWQGWKLCYSGRPRTKDYAEATRRRIQQAKEETQYAEAEAELERKATILTIDLREAQNLTNRVLSTHSMKLKTMLSELSVKVAESLYTTEMRPKDVALTLVSLKVVGEHLHRWSEEPSVAQTEQKKNWAINIPLQCTPRERLKELAIASNGAVAPEPMHKDLSGGLFPNRPEHAPAGGDGLDDRKGDPKEPAKEKKKMRPVCTKTVMRGRRLNTGTLNRNLTRSCAHRFPFHQSRRRTKTASKNNVKPYSKTSPA